MKKVFSLFSILMIVFFMSACSDANGEEFKDLVILDTFEKLVSTEIPEPDFEDVDGPIFFAENLTYTISEEHDLMNNVFAKDNVDGFVTDEVTYTVVSADGEAVSDTTSLNIGQYIITYEVTDAAGNTSTLERLLKITPNPDTEPPVIEGTNDLEFGFYYLAFVTEYIMDGVTAHDEYDGIVTTRISYSVYDQDNNEVTDLTTLTPGTYKLIYTVDDMSGNAAEVDHTMKIIAPSGPIEYDFDHITVIAPKISTYDVLYKRSMILDNFRVLDGNGYLITDLVDIKYVVYDGSGRRVLSQTLADNYLAAGVYTVKYDLFINGELKVEGEYKLKTDCFWCKWQSSPPLF